MLSRAVVVGWLMVMVPQNCFGLYYPYPTENCLSGLKSVQPLIGAKIFDVTKFGAKGHNRTVDTNGIQAALNACSNSTSGGVVLFPEPGFYRTDALQLSHTDGCALQVEPGATLFANYNTSWGKKAAFLTFEYVTNLSLFGGGVIDGNGPLWWGQSGDNRPKFMHMKHCDTVAVYNLTFVDGANHNLELGADNCEVAHVDILIRWDQGDRRAENTDGIDVHGTPFHVHHCHIDVGDDNIAVHASNVLVEDSFFGGPELNGVQHGHGISIGSVGNGIKMENITFRNLEFNNTHVGPNIKVHGDATEGYVRNVMYDNIIMHGMQLFNMKITTNYPSQAPSQAPRQAPSQVVSPNGSHFEITNILYRNITATGSKAAGNFLCGKSFHCTNITLENVHVAGHDMKDWDCSNVAGSAKDVSPPFCF